MNKKLLILFIIFIFSIIFSIFGQPQIFESDIVIIPIIVNLLAVSLAVYTFIFNPIHGIMKKTSYYNKEDLLNSLNKLLLEYEESMKTIFAVFVLLILIEYIQILDIPLIQNPCNIDFGIFVIKSLKSSLIIFAKDFMIMLSFFCFYDLISATFIIMKSTLMINKK